MSIKIHFENKRKAVEQKHFTLVLLGFGNFLVKNLEKGWFFGFFTKVPKPLFWPVLTLFYPWILPKSNFQVQFADINSRVSGPSEVVFISNLSLDFSQKCLYFPHIGKKWPKLAKNDRKMPIISHISVSYTHLTLPTN